MLSNPVHHTDPFPFFQCADALDPEHYVALEQLFSVQGQWQLRESDLYACELREATADAPGGLLRDAVIRMRAITGLPLTDRVVLTTQRMLPGQQVGVHSDRPLLGYEAVRLVVQLNGSWEPAHGGELQLFETVDGPPSRSIEPRANLAFGFVLHAASHHGVTRVTQPRRSVVFNFWHRANTPELAEAIGALFDGVHFSELPRGLDPVAEAAEAQFSEEATFRASMAAAALQRWGYDDAVIIEGYRAATGLAADVALDTEASAAVLLAGWVARLHVDAFDPAAWSRLRGQLSGPTPSARLSPLWELCLP